MQGGRRTYIGLAIVAAIALAIVALPEGDAATTFVTGLLRAVFLGLLAIAGARFYRQRSDWFAELPDRNRGLLYGAVAVALLAIIATARFGELGVGGILIEVLLLIGCVGVVVWVWNESRRYSY